MTHAEHGETSCQYFKRKNLEVLRAILPKELSQQFKNKIKTEGKYISHVIEDFVRAYVDGD